MYVFVYIPTHIHCTCDQSARETRVARAGFGLGVGRTSDFLLLVRGDHPSPSSSCVLHDTIRALLHRHTHAHTHSIARSTIVHTRIHSRVCIVKVVCTCHCTESAQSTSAYTYTHIHTHTHTYTHIYTHTCDDATLSTRSRVARASPCRPCGCPCDVLPVLCVVAGGSLVLPLCWGTLNAPA